MGADPKRDQYEAATRHAEEVFHRLADDPDRKVMSSGEFDSYDLNHPTAAVVNRVMAAMYSPNTRMCEHAAGSPTVVFCVPSIPAVAVCRDCMPTLMAEAWEKQQKRHGKDHRACDSCGAVCTQGHVAYIHNGPLIIYVCLCTHCAQKEAEMVGNNNGG